MDSENDFRILVRDLAGRLSDENVEMIIYLCKDILPYSREFPNALSVLEQFEAKGLIHYTDMAFLAEILYHINRFDLLKCLPNVKNRRDYEENFLPKQINQNFSPFRICCFQLTKELTRKDFDILKNFCRNKLSKRNYNKSNNIYTLLECLEEEDFISDGDVAFMLDSLQHLDNQAPYEMFKQLISPNHPVVASRQSSIYPGKPAPGSHRSMPPVFSPQNSTSYIGYAQYAPGPFKSLPDQPTRQSYGKVPNEDLTSPKSSYYSDQSADGTGANIHRPATDHNQLRTSRITPKEAALTEASNAIEKAFFHEEIHADGNCEKQRQFAREEALSAHRDATHENYFASVEPSSVDDDDVSLQHADRFVRESQQPNSATLSQVDRYEMNRKPTGVCLIINNSNFEGSINVAEAERRKKMTGHDYPIPNVGFKNRIGSQLDVERVSSLFKSFGFTVKLHENLDSRAMQNVMISAAKSDHSRACSFVLIIMSHGTLGSIYGVDGMPVRCADIKSYFKPVSAPTLLNKPKILIYQACQGNKSMDGHAAPIDDVETDGPLEAVSSLSTPSEADFLICYSTVPGYISYRSRSSGSFFIGRVVENLKNLHQREDVLSIMANVNAELARENLNQMAMPVSTLRKKVFFSIA